MEISERIKKRRKELGLSAEAVADIIGISPATVYRYESSDIMNMGIDKIEPIAKALKTTPGYLMGWESNDSTLAFVENSETIKINIYGHVPAGVPMEAIEDVIGEEDIPTDWTRCGDEYIALRVSGDSMYPKYLDGDIVIIKLQPDCESGQDAVVYVNGYDATLKTIIKQDDGMIRLQPANPEFQPKVFFPKNIKILGVVKRLRRDFV